MRSQTILLMLLPVFVACSSTDGGTGSLTVLLEAEDTITKGLDPGTEGENITDGWQVRFENYNVGIGEIAVAFATDPTLATEDEARFVVDLTTVPASGLSLWSLGGLDEGRWQFAYATATDGATRDDSVSTVDFDAMIASDWTYLIRGTMTQADGLSCPPTSKAMVPMGTMPTGMNEGGDACYPNPSVAFEIGIEAETVYGPCEVDGLTGFAITADSTQTVAATIHGDHLFFNGFPTGDEGGIVRLAQWLADCDLNLDGAVSQAELEAIDLADLAELDDRYNLGETQASNAWEYVRAQLKTQGHFQGEGECPVDGLDHEHDH